MRVERGDVSALAPLPDTGRNSVSGVIASSAARVRAALSRLRRALATGRVERGVVRTLKVHVDGKGVEPGAVSTTACGTAKVAVSRNTNRPIGMGHLENADITTDVLHLRMEAAVAAKFASAGEQLRHLHVDLSVLHMNATSCAGPLTEIWGLRPLSTATAQMLLPPGVTQAEEGGAASPPPFPNLRDGRRRM